MALRILVNMSANGSVTGIFGLSPLSA